MLPVLSDHEWILTNGIGGYALGFGDMINKRKYNGLLIASDTRMNRTHILSTIEERVENNGTFFYLDSNHYPNCIHPNGYNHIVKTWLRPYPCALYSSAPFNEQYLILKEVFLFERQNAVAIKYTNLGSKECDLILRPKFTLRNHHCVNPAGTWDNTQLSLEIAEGAFRVRRSDTEVEAFGYAQTGEFFEDQLMYRSTYYPLEAVRGYEKFEDLVAPVRHTMTLVPSQGSYLVFSSTHLEEPMRGAAQAEQRYYNLPMPANHPAKFSDTASLIGSSPHTIFDRAGYRSILEAAAKDFVLADDDIVAGYPWFGCWGRDTLIAMSGLKCLPRGSQLAVRILKKYGAALKNGRLPNTFGEGGEGLNYDSVDAPLWYVLRCYEYGAQNRDLFSYASRVVLGYLNAADFPFFVADDGLIEIRSGNHAITWMDAKIYGTPVTPRFGKPIEINALWYNALCAIKEMAQNLGENELRYKNSSCTVQALDERIAQVRDALQQFVGMRYLADRIENDQPIWETRPNAVTALSLPFNFVEPDVAKRVWTTAKEELLTRYGLRTLSPSHPAFKQKYFGNQKQRDLAYHQGTVWTYLLLPYAKLAQKVYTSEGTRDDFIREVTSCIWSFRDSFMRGESASVAEIWDGIDPYFPKGCPAQAWSVFALLEIENMVI